MALDGSRVPKDSREADREWTRRCWSESPFGEDEARYFGARWRTTRALVKTERWRGERTGECRGAHPARGGRVDKRLVTAGAVTKAMQGSACFGASARSMPWREAPATVQAHEGAQERPTTCGDRGDGP